MSRARVSVLCGLGLVIVLTGLAAPAQAAPPTAQVVEMDKVVATRLTTTFRVQVPELTGTYTLTWASGPELGGSSSGDLDADGRTPEITVDPTSVPDGQRTISGTISVVDPIFGAYDNIPFTSTLRIDRTAPQVASATAVRTKLYPHIARGQYPTLTSMTITLSADTDHSYDVILRSASGKVYEPDNQTDDLTITADWDAESPLIRYGSTPAEPGTYAVIVVDPSGNETVTDLALAVSSLHEVKRVWKRAFTPRGTLVDRYVGRCSTMKVPSARGWTASIGYYANTRCGAQTARASAVVGVHAVRVPRAYRYSGVFVHGTGAAATARPRSSAFLGVIDTNGDLKASIRMRSGFGTYKTRIAQRVVFEDGTLGWLVRAAFGERYDVKKFTVEVHYWVLVL